MTELELHNFIDENDISVDWRGEQLFIWIPYYDIDDFIKLIKPKFEFEPIATLQESDICIDLVPICEHYDINSENILKKES